MEVELKYKIENKEQIDKIIKDSFLNGIGESGGYENVNMRAAYFDTEDHMLIRNNIAFRVRKEGSKTVASLKWNDTDEGIKGLYVRNEINVPVDDENAFFSPNPAIFRESNEGKDLLDVIDGKPLNHIFELQINRKRLRVDYENSIIEISIDEGKIFTDEKATEIRELEIELFSGNKKALLDLSKIISEKHGLKPELKTKYARGIDLLSADLYIIK